MMRYAMLRDLHEAAEHRPAKEMFARLAKLGEEIQAGMRALGGCSRDLPHEAAVCTWKDSDRFHATYSRRQILGRRLPLCDPS